MPAALVTGVSRGRGIGAATAARLRRAGWSVFTTGWRDYDAEVSLPRHPEQPVDLELNLAEPDAAPRLFDAAGDVSALVLIHTVDLGGGIAAMTPELIDRHLSVNVRATLLLMREFAQRFTGAHGAGRIVLFTSRPPQTGAIAYAASKGAVEWITLSAASELGPRGITVNAVDPGPNDTGWMTPEIQEAARRRTPLGRVGRPEDAAELVAFLLSREAGWITGQSISSDGGHFHNA